MGRMVVAFGILLGAPLLLILFPSQTLSLLLTGALIGGVGYVGYALMAVVRAYRRWAVRRAARMGRGAVARRFVLAILLATGLVVGILLLPAYLAYAALSGLTSAGASPATRGHDTVSLAGFTAVVIVALLVFITPILGIAYVLLTAFLFWLHRTRLRIDGQPATVGIGGLIDWLEHEAARA